MPKSSSSQAKGADLRPPRQTTSGDYELEYTVDQKGAVIGTHTVSITTYVEADGKVEQEEAGADHLQPENGTDEGSRIRLEYDRLRSGFVQWADRQDSEAASSSSTLVQSNQHRL